MEFGINDFNSLRFNVRRQPAKRDLFEAFTVLQTVNNLKDIPKTHNGVDRNAIIRYIVYMYDLNSPLRSAIPNLMERKQHAASLANMPTEKKRFTKEAENIILNKDRFINAAIVSFVTKFNSATYSRLVASENAYQVLLLRMMDGDVDNKTLEMIDGLESSINEMSNRLISEMAGQLKDELYNRIEKEKLALRPEDIAQKLEEGENPVDVSPYGEDYNYEKYPWKNVKLLNDTKAKETS